MIKSIDWEVMSNGRGDEPLWFHPRACRIPAASGHRSPASRSGASQTPRVFMTAQGISDEACLEAMQPTIQTIRQCLGDLVFGEEDDELQDAVIRQLRADGKTLATAEVVSSGLLASWLSEAAGPADTYRGGLVLHDGNALLAACREPNRGVASRYGMDSLELAAALAEQCRVEFGADLGLALGRFPLDEPPRDHYKIPLAIATVDGVQTEWAPYSGHPDIRKTRCTKHALDFVRRQLIAATRPAG